MPVKTSPRLLDESAAADYLSLPVGSLRRIAHGRILIGGRPRWDRLALDAWLDALGGLAPQSKTPQSDNDPEAAFDRSHPDLRHAPRRP